MNIIVREQAYEIRGMARNVLAGNWGKVLLAMVVYVILTGVVPEVVNLYMPGSTYNLTWNTGLDAPLAKIRYRVPVFATLYSLILDGAFTMGLLSFLLGFLRMRRAEYGRLFGGLEFFFRAFCLNLLIAIKVFLWSLLFVIPGIIARFRYAQAFYILADDPRKGAFQCVEESKFLMQGNKWSLFVLDLSFIGWAIVAALPAALYGGLVHSNVIAGIVVQFLPTMLLTTYVQTAEAIFYELATGHMQGKSTRVDDFAYSSGPRGPQGPYQGPQDPQRPYQGPQDPQNPQGPDQGAGL